MFDIGFWEIFAVAVIALLVLGPDRIPGAVRGVSHWWGRLQRYGQHLRAELIEATEVEEVKEVKSILGRQQEDFKKAATRMRELAQKPSWEQFDAAAEDGAGAAEVAGEGERQAVATAVAGHRAEPAEAGRAPAGKKSAAGRKAASKKKTAAVAGKKKATAR